MYEVILDGSQSTKEVLDISYQPCGVECTLNGGKRIFYPAHRVFEIRQK